jgi:hypothetical protein
MSCKPIVMTIAIMLAALSVISPARAGDGLPPGIGFTTVYSYYPYGSYYWYHSPNYYRGRDGYLHPAGPPPFPIPDASPGPPARYLPVLRPRRNLPPSAAPSNEPPLNSAPGQP